MRSAIGLCSTCTLILAVLGGVLWAAEPIDQQQAVQLLKAEAPLVQFNRLGSQIERVYGQPLAYGLTPQQSAQTFVASHAEIFGVSAADLVPEGLHGGAASSTPLGYNADTGEYKFTLVFYQQYKDGIPVYRSDLRLLVRNEHGYPLVLAASTLRDLGDFALPSAAAPVRDDLAIASAIAMVPDLTTFTSSETVIWAGINDMKVAPTLAVTFIADNYDNPAAVQPERWRFVADAATGAILHAESLIRFTDVSGNVSGMATDGPKADICDPEVPMAMPYASVAINGGNSADADVNGNFTIPNSGSSLVTVYSYMAGTYFAVDNYLGAEETLVLDVTPPGPANFMHNAANTDEYVRAQVNGYIQANRVRDWVLTQDPSFPGISTETGVPVYVNRTDGYCPCNAWSDGISINFCSSGGGCPNTAWISVIVHEYGHHVIGKTSSGQGQYGEGMGDCFSVLMTDNPVLGYGFTGDCGTGIRTADNTYQYPCTGDIHDCGQLLSGCVWSTRNELIVTEPADYLSILSYLTVNSIPLHGGDLITPAITTDFLTLDDNDGDLSNGTPHSVEIIAAFSAHNMYAGPPPDHDVCGNAIAACPGTPYSGDTAAATNDGSSSCGDSNSSPDLWYRYTPGANGSATFSLCTGTGYDSVLSVHSGCPGTSSNDLGCDDDGCGSTGGPSTVTISVTAGNTYYIRVTGWNGSVGPYTLNITGPDCAVGALTISFPEGLPEAIEPDVPTDITVRIEDGTETYEPGTGLLYYRYDGGSYQTVALVHDTGDDYIATLPAPDCDDTPEFYFSAEGDLGSVVTSPANAPTSVYSALVGTLTVVMADNFETDQGWVAENLGATSGDWQRGVPVNDPDWDYDPYSDSDGSGQCYLTQNEIGNTDVDDGAVRLTSPNIDLDGAQGVSIGYDYFLRLTNTDGSDRLLVEISSNGTAGPWTQIALHTTDGGLSWRSHTITQSDLDTAGVSLTANMRIRYTANDGGTQSIVEAGLDAFQVSTFICDQGVTYTLTVNVTGQGNVVLNPPGGTYPADTSVQLTADGDPGWHFDHWEDDLTGSTNPDNILMDSDKTVTAVFVRDQYTLTVNISGQGTVDLSPPGGVYDSETWVQLAANADTDWHFDHWEGDMTGSTNPDDIYMDGNKTVTAVFLEDAPVPCPGDLDGDGFRNVSDFTLFANAFGTQIGDPNYNPDADMDGDGFVNTTDFTLFAAVYGIVCP